MSKKKKKSQAPPQAAPIDYGAIMAQAAESAKAQYRDQLAAQIESYPKIEALQLGTIQKVSDNLRNPYTQRADASIGSAADQTARLTQSGDRIGGTAAQANQLAQSAQNFAASPTELDQRISQLGASAMNQRADQVSGAKISNIGQMDYARLRQVADVKGPSGYTPDQIRAAQAGAVGDVSSSDIEASAAERTMMNEAAGGGLLGQLESQAGNELALGRSLSAEQEREAAQSARAGMAARGLGVGNSALAAEMLNRERFATQRETERRAFASGVLNQATGVRQAANQAYASRMDANRGRMLQASLANQATRLNLNQANAQLSQQAQLANQAANARASEFQQSESLRAAMANQQSGLAQSSEQARLQQAAIGASFDSANQRALAEAGYSQQASMANQDANQRQVEMNRAFLQNANQSGINSQISRGGYALGALGQSANLYGQQAGAYQNAAGLGLNLAASNIAADPYMRAFAPGTSIGGGTLGTSANMIGNTYNNATQMAGNVASFNANMLDTRYNNYQTNKTALEAARITGGATSNAGWMALLGGGMQAGGALGGAAINKYSDRRMKKDIKPVGKGGAGGVLGLTTYEFRYKDGDDKKHIGFMAQDVQKVLPEAVEEVQYKGQTRLAIKPKVIGDAIADILSTGQDALFSEGYTVGSGK